MTLKEAISLINNRLTGPNGPVRWADLGCGEGLFTLALASLLPAGSVIYGVDKNNPLKKQTTAGDVDIIPISADFVTDPLPFNNLDGLLMANALHYVKDKEAFIHRVKTITTGNAMLLIVEYDTDTPVPTWVPYPVSFSSLTKLFTGAGYAAVQKLNERPSIYGRAHMYAALVEQTAG
ncbi:MAG TPA: methyltransferase domain-containing protein [Chitinophagaceae bacterium]|nr:methyltransferase domain-containing protein [Chitinophagaceae bacterium]